MTRDGFALSYGGTPLDNNEEKLIDHGIGPLSEVLALMRVSGGAYRILQGRRIERDIHIVNEECIISLEDEDPTMKLPCGHAIAPNSLAEYIKNEVGRRKTELKCPACTKKWEITIIKKMGLTRAEIKNMELGLSKNYLIADASKRKQCPKCNAYLEKTDVGFRVQCPACNQFQFCWKCLKQWKAPGNGYQVCGNTDCGKGGNLIKMLVSCKTTVIEYSGLVVPEIRACPQCGEGINIIGGCKHMTCPTCNHEFCFSCLKKWPCGANIYDVKEKCTVAPRQKTLPSK